jgi:CRISPR/Cas system CMR subunit Cmr6 (Cas7 group RAMP superfamily)
MQTKPRPPILFSLVFERYSKLLFQITPASIMYDFQEQNIALPQSFPIPAVFATEFKGVLALAIVFSLESEKKVVSLHSKLPLLPNAFN